MRIAPVVFAITLLAACTPAETPVAEPVVASTMPKTVEPAKVEPPPRAPPSSVSPSGLQIVVLRDGHGMRAEKGRTVEVHYTLSLEDGRQIESSRSRGPFSFILGSGMVIKGWDEGVLGMRVGEVRKIVVPPELAYGEGGHLPKIPPKSPLVFEIELLAVR